MVKRFKKKSKKTKAQKTVTIKRTSGKKISEAVLDVCKPLLDRYKDYHQRLEVLVIMGVMAWNISLFENKDRTNMQENMIEFLPEQLAGEDLAVILDTIEILIKRKEELYPHIREYIHEHKISFANNNSTMNFTVSTAPVPDKIQKRIKKDDQMDQVR